MRHLRSQAVQQDANEDRAYALRREIHLASATMQWTQFPHPMAVGQRLAERVLLTDVISQVRAVWLVFPPQEPGAIYVSFAMAYEFYAPHLFKSL
jgi:hypothetical protein